MLLLVHPPRATPLSNISRTLRGIPNYRHRFTQVSLETNSPVFREPSLWGTAVNRNW